ncbi:RraA family protein [Georgenia sp. AZ-5]|uniref:RraA family protein n=1 Tax=Georgenia sp. AZ-5 TaxID=3367526 RepID=UPI003754CCF4
MTVTGVADDLIAQAATLPTATLHEAAGKVGALPAAIRPVRPGMRLAGRALPVRGPVGDNLWLHHAIIAAGPGDVLVCDMGAGEYGYWGEVMAVAAQARGIAGLVIDGGVRDGDQLGARGFPTFSRHISIRGTAKDPAGAGSLGDPIQIGDITVRAGDLVVGDDDGVVVLPATQAAAAVAEAQRREDTESEIFDRLVAGENTVEIYGLPGVTR